MNPLPHPINGNKVVGTVMVLQKFLSRKISQKNPGMGFPVRTMGTGNTEHMFSQWGLVGTGNREQGTSHETFAGPPEDKLKFFFGGGESLREQGTGNREQGTCRVPQVFPGHVPEPLRENPSLENPSLNVSFFLNFNRH